MKGCPSLLFAIVVCGAASGDNVRSSKVNRSLQGENIVDFANYGVGDSITALDHGITVTASKRAWKGGPFVDATAMILDSENPPASDKDLGTPNRDFGGSGVGQDGRKGRPFENSEPQGKVLIISQDDSSATPNDHRFGGYMVFTFEIPVVLKEIGLLDNEENTEFDVQQSNGATQTTVREEGGDNSFEVVSLGDLVATQLKVTFGGSGAITYLKFTTTQEPTSSPVTPEVNIFRSTGSPTIGPTLSPTSSPVLGTPLTLTPTSSLTVDSTSSSSDEPPPPFTESDECAITGFVLFDETSSTELQSVLGTDPICIELLEAEGVTIKARVEECVAHVTFVLQGPNTYSDWDTSPDFLLPAHQFTTGQYTLVAFPDGDDSLALPVMFEVIHCDPTRL